MLAHGGPELWYSWRHVLPALAAAGYHAMASDSCVKAISYNRLRAGHGFTLRGNNSPLPLLLGGAADDLPVLQIRKL